MLPVCFCRKLSDLTPLFGLFEARYVSLQTVKFIHNISIDYKFQRGKCRTANIYLLRTWATTRSTRRRRVLKRVALFTPSTKRYFPFYIDSSYISLTGLLRGSPSAFAQAVARLPEEREEAKSVLGLRSVQRLPHARGHCPRQAGSQRAEPRTNCATQVRSSAGT